MTLYLFATLLVSVLAAIVFGDAGTPSPSLWALPLLPALAWTGLRYGRRRLVPTLPGGNAATHQPLTRFALHSGQPALLAEEGRIANANLALLKALGLEARSDELIGMPLDNIVHPKHHRRLAALLAGETAAGDAGVITLLRADGVPWLARVSLFRADRSRVSLLQFSAPENGPHDGSDRQWGSRLAHFAGEILFALDSQLLVTYLNPQWEKATGRAVSDCLFSAFLPLFHSDDRAALTKGLRQLKAGERDSLTLEVRTLAGRALGPRWVELRAWPLDLPASGETGIVGMLLDIDQRRRSEEALRAQRRSLHTMLDNLPGMIYRGQNDRHWTMEFVSEGCFELTGYTPLELVDNHAASFAEMIHPEDRDFVWNYVQMRLARRERYELSYRIIDRDGQTRWVWEQGRGIHSSRGEFLGLEGFITDVSSSRGAQEEARRRLFFDNAAGLLSLSLFLDRLQHLFQHAAIVGYPFAVLHLVVEPLDEIAAHHGAAMAERVMVETGKRLQVVQSDCNGVARHGDGFAVLIADFRPGTLAWAGAGELLHASPEGAQQLAAALVALSTRPLRIDGHAIALRARAGLAIDRAAYPDAPTMLAEAVARSSGASCV
jgi:PAS domain S-box-containing protein